MEGRAPWGTLSVLADDKEEPNYDNQDSWDEEALAQGEISKFEKEAITRRHGVGRTIYEREVMAFLGETIAIIRHQPRSFY